MRYASRLPRLQNRGVLLSCSRVRSIELAVAFLDSARPLVTGNGNADVVRANPFAGGGDFQLGFARCQGEDPIAEAW